MAQDQFLSDGSTPRKTDARWFRWAKMLLRYQNVSGARAANDLRKTDTIREVKQKLLNAIQGTSYTG